MAEAVILLREERQATLRLLMAALHALRSYQYGNASPDLARHVADEIYAALGERP